MFSYEVTFRHQVALQHGDDLHEFCLLRPHHGNVEAAY